MGEGLKNILAGLAFVVLVLIVVAILPAWLPFIAWYFFGVTGDDLGPFVFLSLFFPGLLLFLYVLGAYIREPD